MGEVKQTNSASKPQIDYAKIDEMQSFNEFVNKKNRFLFTVAGCFLTFYIFLPILAFQPVLQQKWIGNITGVWIYSAALFIMTIILAIVYSKKAPKFDMQAQAVLTEYNKDGGK